MPLLARGAVICVLVSVYAGHISSMNSDTVKVKVKVTWSYIAHFRDAPQMCSGMDHTALCDVWHIRVLQRSVVTEVW